MPIWLLPLLKNPALIVGVIATAALGMLLLFKNIEISHLKKDVAAETAKYDAEHSNLLQARLNNATLTSALDSQSASIKDLGQKQDEQAAVWKAGEQERKRADATLAGKLSAIASAKPGADKCASALQLLKGQTQ